MNIKTTEAIEGLVNLTKEAKLATYEFKNFTLALNRLNGIRLLRKLKKRLKK